MKNAKENNLTPLPDEKKSVQIGEFVEIEYKGYANGVLFDSNIDEEVKKLNPETKGEKTIIVVGEGMVVDGLDKSIKDKEIGKDYEVKFGCREGFGERKRELIKTIPLSAYTQHKVNPQAGMSFDIDGQLVRVIAVSGARVITDFNNPLAGKELEYKFKILKKINDEKEKIEATFKNLFRMIPEFKISEQKVIVKGAKGLGFFVKTFSEKFKKLIGKELDFEEMPLKEKKSENDIKR